MSATLPPQTDLPKDAESDNQRALQALFSFIELNLGEFGFAQIEFDLPRQRARIVQALRERFADRNLVEAQLTPVPPDAPRSYDVFDQLAEIVAQCSPDRSPDVLLITGLERLFAADNERADQPSDELVRVLQPLNLGRNLLAQQYPCPVLLLLPEKAMTLFSRLASDISSWRSGFFSFRTDRSTVEKAVEEALREPYDQGAKPRLQQRSAAERRAGMERLRVLIADAEEIGADEEHLTQLSLKLGWVALTLPDRSVAMDTFGQALQWAIKTGRPQLVRSAQRGLKRARRLPVQSADSASVFIDFPGAQAATSRDSLYGRDEELKNLVAQAISVNTRFLIVWGDTGNGKSSLVCAGLIPEMKALGTFLPIHIEGWNATESDEMEGSAEKPEARLRKALRDALEPTQCSDFDRLESLHDQIQFAAQAVNKTVVIVCDQFEQFFASRPLRSTRAPLLQAVGACVKDFRIRCKFLFVIRSDYLGRLAEFDGYVPDPLKEANRFYLPAFNLKNAARVLQQQAEKTGLYWPEAFIRDVVNDLEVDERVSPIKLQIVSATLALKGIQTKEDYARAGRAQGLLADYLDETLEKISDRTDTTELMKRLLLTLVVGEDNPRRQALSVKEIAGRLRRPSASVRKLLVILEGAHLVRPSAPARDTSSPSDSKRERFELIHDVLVDLVRAPQDPVRQANRLLARALREQTVDPKYRLKLSEWRLVRKYADTSDQETPQARRLFRRSLAIAVSLICLWCLLAFTLCAGILRGVQLTSCHFDKEGTDVRRVVVKRGPAWLRLLPGCDTVLFDTGFVETDFTVSGLHNLYYQSHWEWDRRQPGALRTLGAQNALMPINQALLRFRLGSRQDGIKSLLALLTANDPALVEQINANLIDVARLAPDVAVSPLLDLLKNKKRASDARSSAASALAEVVKAKPSLAPPMLQPLLDFLIDKNIASSVRSSAASALAEVVKAKPSLAPPMLQPLLHFFKDESLTPDETSAARADPVASVLTDSHRRIVRSSAASALAEVAKARQPLPQSMLQPMLDILKDDEHIDRNARMSAASALSEAAKAQPDSALQPLLDFLKDKSLDADARSSAASALAEVAKIRPVLLQSKSQPLLDSLKNNSLDADARTSAAFALADVAKIRPTLAQSMLQPLLDILNDISLNTDARMPAASALAEVAKIRPTLAQSMLQPLLDFLMDKHTASYISFGNQYHNYVQKPASDALAEVAKAQPDSALWPLLVFFKNNSLDADVRSTAASALAEVAKAKPSQASSMLQPLLDFLMDGNIHSTARGSAAFALAEVATIRPTLLQSMSQPLLDSLKDKNLAPDAQMSAAFALAKVAKTDPESACRPLLDFLKDKSLDPTARRYAAPALAEVAKARPALAQSMLKPLLDFLKDKSLDTDARSSSASALAEVAKADSGTDIAIFGLFLEDSPDYDTITTAISDPLADVIGTLAAREEHQGRDPVRFLFQHLEGKRSLLPNDQNANTCAAYRRVVEIAMAHWLTAKNWPGREALRATLKRMSSNEPQLVWRIAAWNVLALASRPPKGS